MSIHSAFTPGIRFMLFASFYFAGMAVSIKALDDIHVLEVVFFRSIITAILCMRYLRAHAIPFKGSNHKDLFLRSLYGVITMVLFFITIHRMPLGAAVSLKYLSPIFTAVFVVLFLKEQISPPQWFLFFTAFAGVLMLKGFDARVDSFGLLLGIAGAVFEGLVYLMIRKMGPSEHPMVIINYFMLFASALAGVGMVFYWKNPTTIEWMYLVATGTLGYFGQVYMTKALQVELASKVAPIKYMEVIFTLILGLMWFDEAYNFWSLVGLLVILGSMLLSLMIKDKKIAGLSLRSQG